MSAVDRFWSRVVQDDSTGCWDWQGVPNSDGYAQLKINGRSVKAHRFGYELLVTSIPKGLLLDHLCRNRMCVNPGHLEPVTSGENTRRGETLAARQLAQVACIWGHPLAGANLRVDSRGKRVCRLCNRLRAAQHRVIRGIGSTSDLVLAPTSPWTFDVPADLYARTVRAS